MSDDLSTDGYASAVYDVKIHVGDGLFPRLMAGTSYKGRLTPDDYADAVRRGGGFAARWAVSSGLSFSKLRITVETKLSG